MHKGRFPWGRAGCTGPLMAFRGPEDLGPWAGTIPAGMGMPTRFSHLRVGVCDEVSSAGVARSRRRILVRAVYE